MQTLFYIISISDKKEKKYYQELSVFSMPIETANRKSAYKFSTAQDAQKYAAVFNSNLRAVYQQNGTAEDARVYYKIETISTAVHTFYLSVLIESESNENEIVLDVCRARYTGTFEDAQEQTRQMIKGTAGVLRAAKIESFANGIATAKFVTEYNFPAFENTRNY